MTRPPRFRRGVLQAPVFLLAASAIAFFPATAPAASVFQPGGADDSSSIVDKAKPAIVRVESGDEDLLSAGTGFFIDNQGTVLTSATVVGDSTSVRVTVNGLPLDARVLGNDPRSGLAMLRVNYPDSPFLPLGQSTDLKTGYTVTTLGYPLNLPVTSTQGLISGFEIRYLTRFFATTHIHAAMPISPGQVGGPLLNAHGEVVGLVVPSPDDGRSVYALPVEAIQKIMGDFAQYGCAKHGWVGVTVVEAPDTAHDGRTVRVIQAVPGTPASHSGILPGDIVLRIDSREVYRPADVLDASFFSHVGSNMNVVVRRDEDLFTYTFPVIERPGIPSANTPLSVSPKGQPGQPILVNHLEDK